MDRLVAIAIVAPAVVFAVVEEDGGAAVHAAAASGDIDFGDLTRRQIAVASVVGIGLHGLARGNWESVGVNISVTRAICTHIVHVRRLTIGSIIDGGFGKRAGDAGVARGIKANHGVGHGHAAKLCRYHCRDEAVAVGLHGDGGHLKGGVGRVPLDGIPRGGDDGAVGGRGIAAVGGVDDVVGLVQTGVGGRRHLHRVACDGHGRHARGGTLVAMGERERRDRAGIASADISDGLHGHRGVGGIQVDGELSGVFRGVGQRVVGVGFLPVGGVIHRSAQGGVVDVHEVAALVLADDGLVDAGGGHRLHLGRPTFTVIARVRHELDGEGAIGGEGERILDIAGEGDEELVVVGALAVVNIEVVVVQTGAPVVAEVKQRVVRPTGVAPAMERLKSDLDLVGAVLEGQRCVLIGLVLLLPEVVASGRFGAARIVEIEVTRGGYRLCSSVHVDVGLRHCGMGAHQQP